MIGAMRVLTFLLLLFASHKAEAQSDTDTYLRQILSHFLVTPLPELEKPSNEIIVLGHELFRDRQLSGNENISCHDCHHPRIGTSDAVALALGEGAIFANGVRVQANGHIIPRHSPVLWNLGHDGNYEMFWDSRVRIHRRTGELITPEPKLNDHPEITKHLTTALEAQTIFPLLSPEEMRGQPGTNELANITDNIEVWDALVQKLKTRQAPGGKNYIELFNAAYPDETHNVGHMGNAMGKFIAWRFQINDTPFDRYLAGDNNALSNLEKEGLNIFFGKARCSNCHHGPLLTNQMMMNVGVPPLNAPGATLDRGYFNQFAFKTPALRNVAKTAPYMHNGIYQTLEEVVDHYNDVIGSLYSFQPGEATLAPYNVTLVRENDPEILKEIDDLVFQPFLRNGLNLSADDKKALLEFLKVSLTSPTW